MNPPTGLDGLAPELVLIILHQLPDLESLNCLLQASPTAYRLFNDVCGPRIFEAVLSSGLTHDYTCALIRITISIRCGILPPTVHNLQDLKDLIRLAATEIRYDDPEIEYAPSLHLSANTPVFVLKEMLAVNHKIVQLTTNCLLYYLERFNKLAPSHLIDKEYKFPSHFHPVYPEIGSTFNWIPATAPFPVRNIGPPTWLEKQQVLRIFWRVELFHQVSKSSYLLPDWPENGMPVIELYRFPLFGIWLDDEFDDDGVSTSTGQPYIHQQGTLLEYELIESVLHFIQQPQVLDPNCYTSEQQWPIDDFIGEYDRPMLSSNTSFTYVYFYYISKNYHSPLNFTTFEPFRNLGFAIWSRERMINYGFIPSSGQEGEAHLYFQAWKSILTEEECDKVKKKIEVYYRRPNPGNGSK